ncbi:MULTISPECIES: hypothetical protein [unclassified Micromonospora]|uniref:hypothetical protein n=1 Tax=unclassified Micromonospora TaxID=2617518 RepID=UPI002FEF317C
MTLLRDVTAEYRTGAGAVELGGAVALPVPGGHAALVLNGRHPTVERKPQAPR